ncbi:ATP-dependent DNA helicase [Arachnia rubra]|jgi:uvrD/REP helicase|uniref:DNA 3'-5' helicase n=1 Tax=Arachnia rubra TaxID=1547448 RepID=A0ABX7Y141_9ACTN|nr:ATP-dependent DNA helicase [Arachnia rubra]MBB1571709.1 ATP-dependent helicase [Propionibacterium sp.]MDO4644385.1 ATP-dependent DNA helicase [Propionibacteriaceae bacterium]MBB1575985.1 ATP-dependent helicase [Propionibacterium sp.]QUC06890.1 ATP-dependent helicase [Arachnia rubra]BCR81101.1 ATP-dependent DNA helicase [Arachnia rubra]
MTGLADPGDLCSLLGIPFSQEQLDVICSPLEPQVIVAGAGTGKTTVMAARVVWLAGTGQVRAEQVLGLTFTRKAAAELGVRICRALEQAGLVLGDETTGGEMVFTYDAFAARLVREHGLRLGIEADARLLSGASRFRVAARAVAEHSHPLRKLSRLSVRQLPERVLALDSALGSHLVTPAQVREFSLLARARFDDAPLWRGSPMKAVTEAQAAIDERLELLELVETYRALKKRLGLVEFADQQAQAVELARLVPAVGAALRQRFRVVLLDEYQDTSSAQAILLRALFSGDAPERGRGFPVTAVGDPNQAIYGWRGAAASNILGFPSHFPRASGEPAAEFTLTTNRRSGSRILDVGNAMARPLTQAMGGGVELQPAGETPPGRVVTRCFDTLAEELDWLAFDLSSRHAEGVDWRDIAVLTRRNDILGEVWERLRERAVPVEIVGLGGLLRLPEIAPVVATLKVLADPLANAEVAGLLTGERWNLGLADLAALARRARELAGGQTGQEVLPLSEDLMGLVTRADLAYAPSLLDAINDMGEATVSEEGRARLERFAAELADLRRCLNEPVPELVRRVISRLGVETEQLVHADTSQLARFVSACSTYPDIDGENSLAGLLAWLDAEEEHGDALELATPTAEDSVKLLTIHRAKGLEWNTVYLPALSEGVFPGMDRTGNWNTNSGVLPAPLRGDSEAIPQLAEYSKRGIETYRQELKQEYRLSEDRLAYVAATRAKQLLVLSAHTWAPGLKRPRGRSRYFEDAAVLQHSGPSVPPPEENPQPSATRIASWPTPVTERAAANSSAAALVQRAREVITTGGDETSWVWGSGMASAAEQERIAAWDRDAAFLTEQLMRRRNQELTLPAGLSATALMELRKDPAAFAERLARRMPREPKRSARLGERFHEWVMSRFSVSPGFDELDFRPSPDDPALESLKQAFEASPFSGLVPLGIEVPFLLRWDSLVLRGRIDAVFPSDDPAFDALVVDWKIGDGETDPLQLAIYRQAWAKAQDLDPVRVATAFHHVLANRLEPVVAGPELIQAATATFFTA